MKRLKDKKVYKQTDRWIERNMKDTSQLTVDTNR